VVGKGLIGSAAAKYLQSTLAQVAVVGPDEPVDPDKAMIFASHYDQGRVQRTIGLDPIWTRLNKQSAIKYDNLAKESGIQFHYPVGCLYVSPNGKDEYLKGVPEQALQFNVGYQFLETGEAIHKAIPDFQFPDQSFAMLEPAPSGHLNPLRLIEAQLAVFQANGGTTLKDTVLHIHNDGKMYQVQLQNDTSISAPVVLVAAGAFSNFNNILPRSLDLFLKSETVLLAKVSKDEAKRLAHLPSFLYEIDNGEMEGIYAIRPIEYPDGNYYLKIGCNLSADIKFNELKEIQDWFRSGNSDRHIELIKNMLHSIMPALQTEGYQTKRCVISRTKHKKPYIGRVDGHNLFVAVGGNGYAAMCSDALGKVAAHMVLHGDTPEDFDSKTFEPLFSN